MLFGYERISTNGGHQSADLQRDALVAAGFDARHIYGDSPRSPRQSARENWSRRVSVTYGRLLAFASIAWHAANTSLNVIAAPSCCSLASTIFA